MVTCYVTKSWPYDVTMFVRGVGQLVQLSPGGSQSELLVSPCGFSSSMFFDQG